MSKEQGPFVEGKIGKSPPKVYLNGQVSDQSSLEKMNQFYSIETLSLLCPLGELIID